jgi:hypothetical protein
MQHKILYLSRPCKPSSWPHRCPRAGCPTGTLPDPCPPCLRHPARPWMLPETARPGPAQTAPPVRHHHVPLRRARRVPWMVSRRRRIVRQALRTRRARQARRRPALRARCRQAGGVRGGEGYGPRTLGRNCPRTLGRSGPYFGEKRPVLWGEVPSYLGEKLFPYFGEKPSVLWGETARTLGRNHAKHALGIPGCAASGLFRRLSRRPDTPPCVWDASQVHGGHP